MSLSKKNLGKLNTFMKKDNLINSNSRNNPQKFYNSANTEDPSKTFYSIIDNSDTLDETSEPNQLLKRNEEIFHKNSIETNCSNNLSIEDQLYDEFNYLLDE